MDKSTDSELAAAWQISDAWQCKWRASEIWRKAYQEAYREAKHKLYAMGGAITEAAIAVMPVMPCNEGELDKWHRHEYIHRDAIAPLKAALAAAQKDSERLDHAEAIIAAIYRNADNSLWFGTTIHGNGRDFDGADFRAAIDAAREEK